MTEEEYFRKNYPDSCYGDKPLSPYWDFFEDGVEFGERQSEKKIEELKSELTKKADTNHSLIEQMADLESKNAELKEKLEKETNHRIQNFNKAIEWKEKHRELKKENAELKEQQFTLRNERNTFLAQNEQYEKDLIDFNEQLTKAKEIIKEVQGYIENIDDEGDELYDKIEQFLKE